MPDIYDLLDTHVGKLQLISGSGGLHTGLSPTARVYRDSDGKYLDTGTGTWVSSGGSPDFALVEIGSEGVYTFEFTPSSYGPPSNDSYTILYEAAFPLGISFSVTWFLESVVFSSAGGGGETPSGRIL